MQYAYYMEFDMEKKITLSVAIATFNEEKNIDACLTAVSQASTVSSAEPLADEIVIVDGGSSDTTCDIAKKYHATIIHTGNPPVFHINKQKTFDACHGEWILQLDADEIVTEELQKEILHVIQEQASMNQQPISGYYIPRKNFFWGHFMKKGGQYPDYVIRLIRNGKAHFPCKSVHEQIEVDGTVGY